MIFDDLIFMIFGDFLLQRFHDLWWFLMIFHVIFWERETSIFPALIQDHQKSWS